MNHTAQTVLAFDDAVTVIGRVCDHLATHDVAVKKSENRTVLTSRYGVCDIAFEGQQATIMVRSDTPTGRAVLEEQVADHLIEVMPSLEEQIVWSGLDRVPSLPVWFCVLSVVETQRLTPHMQRIRFTGSDLHRYAGLDDIHVRLMIPQGNGEPQWPTVTANGVTHYPEPDVLAIRKYTVRQIDPEAGTVDIDFVLHEDAGPGSAFALAARAGDIIGLAGPGGRSAPLDRDWYLFAGDETALPAIARLLGKLPPHAQGHGFIEVADADEQQDLVAPSGVEIHWLHRDAGHEGKLSPLFKAVAAVTLPAAGTSLFAWAGCEHETAMAIRSHLHKERGIAKKDGLIVSYWRRGSDEPE